MYKAKEYGEHLLDICQQVEKDSNDLFKELSRLDLLEQDLLHKIEFTKFNASEGYKMAFQIKETRQIRRKIKEEIAAIEHLKRITPKFVEELVKANKYIKKQEESVKYKTYTPKIMEGDPITGNQ